MGREIGIQEIHNKGIKPNNIELIRRDYCANDGWETFLEYGDPEQDILIGLLRLRKCSKQSYRKELKNRASIVRELHGYGSLLMEEAERIARDEHKSSKIAVISGVGTRNYYRKLGYELDGPYMSKMLL